MKRRHNEAITDTDGRDPKRQKLIDEIGLRCRTYRQVIQHVQGETALGQSIPGTLVVLVMEYARHNVEELTELTRRLIEDLQRDFGIKTLKVCGPGLQRDDRLIALQQIRRTLELARQVPVPEPNPDAATRPGADSERPRTLLDVLSRQVDCVVVSTRKESQPWYTTIPWRQRDRSCRLVIGPKNLEELAAEAKRLPDMLSSYGAAVESQRAQHAEQEQNRKRVRDLFLVRIVRDNVCDRPQKGYRPIGWAGEWYASILAKRQWILEHWQGSPHFMNASATKNGIRSQARAEFPQHDSEFFVCRRRPSAATAATEPSESPDSSDSSDSSDDSDDSDEDDVREGVDSADRNQMRKDNDLFILKLYTSRVVYGLRLCFQTTQLEFDGTNVRVPKTTTAEELVQFLNANHARMQAQSHVTAVGYKRLGVAGILFEQNCGGRLSPKLFQWDRRTQRVFDIVKAVLSLVRNSDTWKRLVNWNGLSLNVLLHDHYGYNSTHDMLSIPHNFSPTTLLAKIYALAPHRIIASNALSDMQSCNWI